MKIEDLKAIGRKLLEVVPQYRFATDAKEVIRVGASGDETFHIDKTAEEIIISHLESLNEPFHIVSEEYGFKDIKRGGMRVLIDPIDGSKNAISGLPIFCTSIAIADGDRIGDIFLSYVINLISGDEFWAESDKGAYLNGKKMKTQESDEINVILYEAQKPSRDLPEILPLLSLSKRVRCLGATALDLAYLSYGAVSVFVCPSPSRSFDFGGGWLLVEESGGIFTDIRGNGLENVEIGINTASPLMATANEKIHKKALEVLKGF